MLIILPKSDKPSVITLNDGGALRTSMDQIFHPLSQIQASAVKETVKTGVDFNGGYLIFDDDQYTVQQVASAVNTLQDAGPSLLLLLSAVLTLLRS